MQLVQYVEQILSGAVEPGHLDYIRRQMAQWNIHERNIFQDRMLNMGFGYLCSLIVARNADRNLREDANEWPRNTVKWKNIALMDLIGVRREDGSQVCTGTSRVHASF